MNIDYFIPDEENQTRGFNDDAMARLRKYSKIKQISFFSLSLINKKSAQFSEKFNQLILNLIIITLPLSFFALIFIF